MKSIQSLFSDKWVRRFMVLGLVLGMSFFIAAACDDDDCGFDQINFTPVVDEDECIADCEANFCDGECVFTPPDGCIGNNCDICDIIDDDDIL